MYYTKPVRSYQNYKQRVPSTQAYRANKASQNSRYRRYGQMANRRNQTSYAQIRKASGEKKGVDTQISVNPFLATTNTNVGIVPLNLIQTGNGSWNRVGKKVYNKSVRITGNISLLLTMDDTGGDFTVPTARMVVVWDKQPSGNSIPSFDTIFGRTDQSGTENTAIYDPIKYDNMGRFSILRDCCIDFAAGYQPSFGGTTPVILFNRYVDEYIKLGNKETIYSGQSTPMSIADVSTGALYVCFRSDIQDAAVTVASSNMYARLRYSD